MKITAACFSDLFFSPPLFILPGQLSNRAFMDQCCVTNVAITKSPKGSIKYFVFIKCLLNFEQNIHGFVKRPTVLVYEGYGSNYSTNDASKAMNTKVIIFILPANKTHLIHPSDISVFKLLKTVLKRRIEEHMIEKYATYFSKSESVEI